MSPPDFINVSSRVPHMNARKWLHRSTFTPQTPTNVSLKENTTMRKTLAVSATALTLAMFAGSAFAQDVATLPGATETPNVAAQTAAEVAPPAAPAALAEIKAKGAAAIADRLARLQVLTGRVAGVRGDCGDTNTLNAQLAADLSGLTALGATLAAETDIAKARIEYRTIFGGFRIYILQSPKTYIVVNCGNNTARIARLQAAIAEVQAKVNAAIAAGKDASASQAFLVTASGLVSAAAGLGTASSNAVIALTPDQGDKAKLASNKAVLAGATTQIKQADSNLQSASANVRSARQALPRNTKPAKGVVVAPITPATTPVAA